MQRRLALLLVLLALVAATAFVGVAAWRVSGRALPGQLEFPQSEVDVNGVRVAADGAAIRAVQGDRISVRASSLAPKVTLESKAETEVRLQLDIANAWRRAGKLSLVVLEQGTRHEKRAEGRFEVSVKPGERVTLAVQGPPRDAQEFEFVVVQGTLAAAADWDALLRSLGGDPPAFLVHHGGAYPADGWRGFGSLLARAEDSEFPVFFAPSGTGNEGMGDAFARLTGHPLISFEHAGSRFILIGYLSRMTGLARQFLAGELEAARGRGPILVFLPYARPTGLAEYGAAVAEALRGRSDVRVCFADTAGVFTVGADGTFREVPGISPRAAGAGRSRALRLRVTRDGGLEQVRAWQPRRTWQGRCTVARAISTWAHGARREAWLAYAGALVGSGWLGLLVWLVGRRAARFNSPCRGGRREAAEKTGGMGNGQPAIRNPQPAIGSRQPAVGNRQSQQRPVARAVGAVLGVLFAGWLYLDGLGDRHISVSNESNRIEATREMVLSGDRVIPRINGRVYLTKPPLYYWLCAALWPGDGPNEFRWRLPSVLAAFACLAVMYGFARRWFGGRVGLVSLAVLGASPLFFLQAREAELDMQLCLLTTLSLCLFYSAIEAERRRMTLFVAAFVALAGATLTKGPVPLVIVLLTLAFHLILTRGARRKCWPGLLVGAAVLVVLVAPWCVAVVRRLGWKTAWGILMEESVRRVGQASRINSAPWHFYLGRVAATFFPWSLWIPAAGVMAWREARRWRESPIGRALLFLSCWFVPPFIFFSSCAGKEAQYILPLYPALAVACAVVAVRWWEGSASARERWAFGAGTCLAAVALLVGGAAAPGILARELEGAQAGAAALGAVALVAGAAALMGWRRRALAWVLVAFIAVFAAGRQIYVSEFIPRENADDSVRAFCRRVAQIVPSEVPIFMFGRERSAYSLYTGRIVREMAREAKTGDVPGEGQAVYFLTTVKESDHLARERPDLARCELASHTGHPSVLIANRAAVARARAAPGRRLPTHSAENP